MSDVHSQEQRCANMRAIRNKNTLPEMQIRRMLFAQGFRFRLHVKDIPGSPDIVLPKHRVTIFVHGCFWHGHGCHMFKVPQTRQDFWMNKIGVNKERDLRTRTSLLESGWRVLTVWECALKGKYRKRIDIVQDLIKNWILAADPDILELDIRCDDNVKQIF